MRRLVQASIIAGILALLAGVSVAIDGFSLRMRLVEGEARAAATLALTLRALEGHVRRLEAVPALLAEQEEVQRFVANRDDRIAGEALNRWLAAKAQQFDAVSVHLMALDGRVIAASDHVRPDGGMGRSFAGYPHFTRSLAGDRGRFYGIVRAAGQRGYHVAAPVRAVSGDIAGVITVTVGLDEVEADWRRQEAHILVTDPEGIVFLSSDPRWLFRATAPRDRASVAASAVARRYAELPVTPLPLTEAQVWGQPVVRIAAGDPAAGEFVGAHRLMSPAGWTVHVLLATEPMRAAARWAAAVGLLVAGLALLAGALTAQRLARRARTKVELERRVIARTADLARANERLAEEIVERRLTDEALRHTQADLVQAGKLAALGTMSAALSHEINQPLAAARNYADSAGILIDRGDTARAKENVGQIMTLIDRMADIARHLRHVARKPDQPLQDVALPQAVAEALATAATRLTDAGAEVTVELPPDLPLVRGGPVRLQQVLVNVLSNAADAVAGREDRRIMVTAGVGGGRVLLSIRDHGPGVPKAIADRIFDPFFTTKRVGAGMGLGLSISYNILKDFGGELRVANDPEGGAVFTLDLQAAGRKRVAAE